MSKEHAPLTRGQAAKLVSTTGRSRCCRTGLTATRPLVLCDEHDAPVRQLAQHRSSTVEHLLFEELHLVTTQALAAQVEANVRLLQVALPGLLPRRLDAAGLLEDALEEHATPAGPGQHFTLMPPGDARQHQACVARWALGLERYSESPVPEAFLWRVLGVGPDLAAAFSARFSSHGPGRYQPTTHTEVELLRPFARPLQALRAAALWHRHLGGPRNGLDPALLVEHLAHLQAHAPYQLLPASLQAYRLPEPAAAALHTALTRHGLVASMQPAAEEVLPLWRNAGYGTSDLPTWLGNPQRRRERPRQPLSRDPFRHAALRDAGAPDLAAAEEALLAWEQVPQADPDDVWQLTHSGVPLDWAVSFLQKQYAAA